MNNKEIIKYFYEVVVSENLLNELPQYISKNCVQKVGANEMFIGINGMRQHLAAVKKLLTCSINVNWTQQHMVSFKAIIIQALLFPSILLARSSVRQSVLLSLPDCLLCFIILEGRNQLRL